MAFILRRTVFKKNSIIVRNFNKLVITDDGSTIVALHLDTDFPYENSRPIAKEVKDTSLLKMSDLKEVQRVIKDLKPDFARKELSSLTLTTVHRWFPRARDKRAKKTEMNRPYL